MREREYIMTWLAFALAGYLLFRVVKFCLSIQIP